MLQETDYNDSSDYNVFAPDQTSVFVELATANFLTQNHLAGVRVSELDIHVTCQLLV